MSSDTARLTQALKAAHEAGDTAAATKLANVLRARQSAPAPTQAPAPDQEQGYGANLQAGNDAYWKNAASTVGHLGYEGAAETLAGLTEAPANYKAPQVLKDPNKSMWDLSNYDVSQLDEAVVEALPQLGYGLLGAAFGPVGATITAGLSGASQTYGPTLDARMREQDMTDKSQLTSKDKLYAGGASLANAALERIGLGKVGKAAAAIPNKGLRALNQKGRLGQAAVTVTRGAAKTAREGIQEAASSGVQQAAETIDTPGGLDVRGNQMVVEGLTGAGARGLTAAPGVGIKVLDNLAGPQYKAKNKRNAALMANIMEDTAIKGGYKTDDLTSNQYANETSKMVVKGTYQRIAEGIKEYARLLKPLMDKETPDLAELDFDSVLGIENPTVREDGSRIADPLDPESKIVINTAFRAGRNQHEGSINPDAIELIRQKFGQFEEGQRLIEYLGMAEEFKRFHDSYRKGPTGGILGSTWNSRPVKALRSRLGSNLAGGALAASGIGAALNPGLAAGAVASMPATLAAAGGFGALAGGALALDKYTGRRNKVERLFSDYGSDKVKISERDSGVSVADYNRYQDELQRIEADALRGQEDALKLMSEGIFRDALTSETPLSRDWLMDNSDFLTPGHFKALNRRIDAQERKAQQDELRAARTREQQTAILRKGIKTNLLKQLTDEWKNGQLTAQRLLEVRGQLTPQEYQRFQTKKIQQDKNIIREADRRAKAKLKAQDAEIKAMEADIRELKKQEAAETRELAKQEKALMAAALREKIAEERADQRKTEEALVQLKVDAESDLTLKEHNGVLQDTDVLLYTDVLGPARVKSWLAAARRLNDKKIREIGKKASMFAKMRVHKGTPKPPAPEDPMKDIGKKMAAINAVAKMRKAEMDRVSRPRGRPTPAVQAEALGGAEPVVSRGMQPQPNSREIQNEARYNKKVQLTTMMEDEIIAAGEAYKNTIKHSLGVALVKFIENIRTTAKNDIEYRAWSQKEFANELDAEYRKEFKEITDELTMAFGIPLSVFADDIKAAKAFEAKLKEQEASGAADVPF